MQICSVIQSFLYLCIWLSNLKRGRKSYVYTVRRLWHYVFDVLKLRNFHVTYCRRLSSDKCPWVCSIDTHSFSVYFCYYTFTAWGFAARIDSTGNAKTSERGNEQNMDSTLFFVSCLKLESSQAQQLPNYGHTYWKGNQGTAESARAERYMVQQKNQPFTTYLLWHFWQSSNWHRIAWNNKPSAKLRFLQNPLWQLIFPSVGKIIQLCNKILISVGKKLQFCYKIPIPNSWFLDRYNITLSSKLI